ncbi:hypothetical protein [Kitasatospora sp. NPDC097691]|uniref:hypothetical protein n=1 Tax=Kitasatospora sp. NPDC097691 TaxID=3157231 RepID=UPI0033330580
MPAVIAKKALTFSLVSIQVGVVAATGEHRVPLHEVHAKDGASLGAKLWWEAGSGDFVQLSAVEADASPCSTCGAIAGRR